MAETDWTELSGSLAQAVIVRGATTGDDKPNGGGNFVFGFNSLAIDEGAAGLYVNKDKFNPLKNDALAPTGGSIRGAIKRRTSGGTPQINFAPMFFINLQGNATNETGYLLGLEDSDPHRIVLRKGSPIGGMSQTNALRISDESFQPNTWLHLRLDSIFNSNGDVILKVFRNDLTVNSVTNPSWQTVPGMDDVVDDVLGVNSGSIPLSGGFVGFAFFSKDLQKRGSFDQIETLRQK